MKSRNINKKRGFSLLEAVIAMSLVAIIFGLSMTTILTAAKSRARALNTRYFVSEISNYLECYKMHGSLGFVNNMSLYLSIDDELHVLNSDEGTSYVVYYSADYAPLRNQDNAAFVLTITIDRSFFAFVKEVSTGDNVYYMNDVYVSRFDL